VVLNAPEQCWLKAKLCWSNAGWKPSFAGFSGGACAPGATLAKPDGCWGVRG